ncbi:glycosyltransferase family 4 protein [Kutzneria sp. NPDC052558]|uniref:glycosyltransferase family 4 protein n=1 Tax=Kutzneria sp. NPDC052558 TaxID=3364121 RepID=UPI0037CACDA9
MTTTTTSAGPLWYYWDRPRLGWRQHDAPFGDGLSFTGLPAGRTIRARNRNSHPATLDGHVLEPGAWTELPAGALATRGAEHNLQLDLSAISDDLPTRTPDGRPLIDWWGAIDAVRGYGRQSTDMWHGLRDLGVEARLHPSQYQHSVQYQAECQYVDQFVIEQARHTAPPTRIAVAMTPPFDPVLYENPSPIKIAITQHDTDTVPACFAERVNRCTHLIVTSSFQRETWTRAGVTVPISVLVSGVDTDVFTPVDRQPADVFKVLILGALTPRKNVESAIRIFQAASEGDPSWQLTIHNRGKLEHAIKAAAAGDQRISIRRADDSPTDVADLYRSHDCFLWPSKAEGVGLPPMEAMASGMELVCASNSGMLDYLDDEWAWPIRCSETVPADAPGEEFVADFVANYGPAGNYWLVDEQDGIRQLRAARTAWRDGNGKGAKAAEYVRTQHDVRAQARSILSVVEQYL